jgi:RNA polymerase sigma-70 factor (ECF subfamily)
MMDQHDADMMRRWQEGDAGAFEELVRRWQQPVGRLVSRLAGNPDQAADLCQEVFVRLYMKAAGYRESGAFSSWLYQIALNVTRDAARRSRRAPLPLEEHDPPAAAASGEAACEYQELTRLVQEALADLPAPLREVLVLRHYQDMNFEQMARLLNTAASTLKSRFAVALTRLRGRLKQLGWSPEETTG